MSGAGPANTTDNTNFFKARLTSGLGHTAISWFFDEENDNNNEVNHNIVSEEETDLDTTLNEESKEYLFRCDRLQKK